MGFQLRSADSKELKAIIVPKPMLLSAEPRPGIQTVAATLRRWERAPRCGGNAAKGAAMSMASSGLGAAAMRRDRVQGSDDQHGDQRDQCRRDGNAGEATEAVERGAKRSSERKCCEHRHTDPSDDFSRIRRPCERQPPADAAGDDETFGGAEGSAAKQKDGNRHPRRADEAEG